MKDPTRPELIAFLEGIYREETGEPFHTENEAESDDHDGCGCRFDIEGAAYWLATDFHGGQWSNLYSVLSTSEYRPGHSECSPEALTDENYTMHALYTRAAAWLME